LAVTTTLNGLVVYAWVTEGRQLTLPLVASNVAFEGAMGRLSGID